MKNTLYLLLLFLAQNAHTQGFTKWVTGDTADFQTTEHLPGIVLAGGGTDNDDAMQWMLQRAAGGDVVVIRASGSNGYNDYFFSDLGVNVNSVETIRFDALEASTHPYVIQQIRNAEVLFIAGGNQYNYYTLWKDTPIEEAIQYLILEKQATVGGTSAGMAILGEAYYTPSGGSLDTKEALPNPFHPDVDILGMGDFLLHPLLPDLVTDTHYDQRDRAGRHVVFLARLAQEHGLRTYGIACNEVTAVCVDGEGLARVFGEHPDYDDYAYFLQTNCQPEFLPEAMQPNVPLTWERNGAAVKVYRAPGKVDGSTTFNLNDWQTGAGGEWFDWYVVEGTLFKSPNADPDCGAFTSPVGELVPQSSLLRVSPNPTDGYLLLDFQAFAQLPDSVRLLDALGRPAIQLRPRAKRERLDLGGLPGGFYWVEALFGGQLEVVKVVKRS